MLADALRMLEQAEVIDFNGHMSCRVPGTGRILINSGKSVRSALTADDIIEIDMDGQPVGHDVVPPMEFPLHTAIYRARPDVNAVVHSHSPAVIPFSVTERPMRPLYHMASFLHPGVPVFEIRQAGGMTDMLIGNPTLGRALAKTLADKNVALMRGHGNVVVADTLPMAVFRAVYTEVNARLQMQAIALGGPINFLAAEEGEKAMRVLENTHLRAWDIWKRTALNNDAR